MGGQDGFGHLLFKKPIDSKRRATIWAVPGSALTVVEHVVTEVPDRCPAGKQIHAPRKLLWR